MTGDFETLRGIKRGDKPNPVSHLYKAYLRWCEKHGVEASEERAFLQYFVEYRGYKLEKHRERNCLMLNKWIVCKSAMFKIRKVPRARRCKHCGSVYRPKTP